MLVPPSRVKQFVREALNAYIGSHEVHDDTAHALENSEFQVRYVHSASQANAAPSKRQPK